MSKLYKLIVPDKAQAIIASTKGVAMFMSSYTYPIELRKSAKEENALVVNRCINCWYNEQQECSGGIGNIVDGKCLEYDDWNRLRNEYQVIEATLPEHFIYSNGNQVKMYFQLDGNRVHPFTMLGNVDGNAKVCQGDNSVSAWDVIKYYQMWLDARHNGDYQWYTIGTPSELATNWIKSIDNNLISEFILEEYIGKNPKILDRNKSYAISSERSIDGYKSIRRFDVGNMYLLEKL